MSQADQQTATVHPAHAHAAGVCGFILTDENVGTFSDSELDAWESAIDEWFASHPDHDPSELDGTHAV